MDDMRTTDRNIQIIFFYLFSIGKVSIIQCHTFVIIAVINFKNNGSFTFLRQEIALIILMNTVR